MLSKQTFRFLTQTTSKNVRCFLTPGKNRQEKDTFGPIEVPGDKYWGAQTQRSL
jgi:hypothetical protein